MDEAVDWMCMADAVKAKKGEKEVLSKRSAQLYEEWSAQ